MSNLTKNNTGNIFGKGSAREFFAKKATLISTQYVLEANAQKSFIANKAMSKSNPDWSGELVYAAGDKNFYANKAMTNNSLLASGKERNVAPELAQQMIERMEKETIAQMAILNSSTKSK